MIRSDVSVSVASLFRWRELSNSNDRHSVLFRTLHTRRSDSVEDFSTTVKLSFWAHSAVEKTRAESLGGPGPADS